MRAVVQRVSRAKVSVDNKVSGQINQGLLVYLGVSQDDKDEDLNYILNKVIGLRIFQDVNDKMNLSIEDIDGDILVISQFTLYGDVRKGRRPNFMQSAKSDDAKIYYNKFISELEKCNINVESGIFGADMDVEYNNDGPVTILLDSEKLF